MDAPSIPTIQVIDTEITPCCPRCQAELGNTVNTRGKIWLCEQCEGRSVTISTLRKTLSEGAVNSLWQDALQDRVKNSGVACPFCLRDMAPVRHLLPDETEGEVEIDVCSTCSALWFDGRELEKMKRHFGLKQPSQTGAAAPLMLGQAMAANEGARVKPAASSEQVAPTDFNPDSAEVLIDLLGDAISFFMED